MPLLYLVSAAVLGCLCTSWSQPPRPDESPLNRAAIITLIVGRRHPGLLVFLAVAPIPPGAPSRLLAVTWPGYSGAASSCRPASPAADRGVSRRKGIASIVAIVGCRRSRG